MKVESGYVKTGFVEVEILDVDTLARNWWVVLLRGIAAIVFGIITFVAPAISFAALVFIFGAYALVDGVLAVVSAIRWRGATDRWWVLLLEGLAGIPHPPRVLQQQVRHPHQPQHQADAHQRRRDVQIHHRLNEHAADHQQCRAERPAQPGRSTLHRKGRSLFDGACQDAARASTADRG